MEHFIGEPDHQVANWDHPLPSHDDAIASQLATINQYLEHPIPEAHAVYDAMAQGWLTPDGTSPTDLGKLFDLYEVPNHRVDGATIELLCGELQQGHHVILGVNSPELWSQGSLAEFGRWLQDEFGHGPASASPADHSVRVTGVDVTDRDRPHVVISNPHDPHGESKTYPAVQFFDAWQNSNFHYVATNAPPPGAEKPAFDLGAILGPVTTFTATAFHLNPALATAAGEAVSKIVDNVDWKQLWAMI